MEGIKVKKIIVMIYMILATSSSLIFASSVTTDITAPMRPQSLLSLSLDNLVQYSLDAKPGFDNQSVKKTLSPELFKQFEVVKFMAAIPLFQQIIDALPLISITNISLPADLHFDFVQYLAFKSTELNLIKRRAIIDHIIALNKLTRDQKDIAQFFSDAIKHTESTLLDQRNIGSLFGQGAQVYTDRALWLKNNALRNKNGAEQLKSINIIKFLLENGAVLDPELLGRAQITYERLNEPPIPFVAVQKGSPVKMTPLIEEDEE